MEIRTEIAFLVVGQKRDVGVGGLEACLRRSGDKQLLRLVMFKKAGSADESSR